jgi:hypothetical protein
MAFGQRATGVAEVKRSCAPTWRIRLNLPSTR